MADGPFGPWRLKDAADAPTADEELEDRSWETGTVIDLYIPIYRDLNKPGKDGRAPISPSEADGMDISVIAVLLGMTGEDDTWARWEREMFAGRKEAEAKGERWEWPD